MLRNCKMACARFRSLVGAVIVFFLDGELRVHSAHPCASPYGRPSVVRTGFLPFRHFFCVAKRNEPKKRPPGDLALRASLRFSEPAASTGRENPAITPSCCFMQCNVGNAHPTKKTAEIESGTPIPSVAPSTAVLCR
jgi:hypothetical protein